MKALQDYFAHSGVKQIDFARMIGVTPGRVSQMLREPTVSAETAIKIEKATGGEITRAQLRPDIFGEAA